MRQKPSGNEIGRAIRVVRTAQGLNRRELAERSGVSYPYLSEIEAGKKTPSPGRVEEIAAALGVAPHELWRYGEELASAADPSEDGKPLQGGHFHAAVRDSAAPLPMAAPPQDAFPSPPEGNLVEEVTLIARRLAEDDARLLLDLARRLDKR
jgi:transcriptional regulator with XRE-family HTH domain